MYLKTNHYLHYVFYEIMFKEKQISEKEKVNKSSIQGGSIFNIALRTYARICHLFNSCISYNILN